MKEKTYLVVQLEGTDGEIEIVPMTVEQIKKLAKETWIGDFAIVEGKVLKSFNSKNLSFLK